MTRKHVSSMAVLRPAFRPTVPPGRGPGRCPLSRAGAALLAVCVLFVTAGPARAQDARSGDVAIVVSPDVPVNDLTFSQVRELLLGDRQYWVSGLRVYLLMRAPVARERDVILKTVYRMTEAEFRRYWIERLFRAEAQTGPRIVYSNESATELVATIPGAVAFVDAAEVPKGLKVLRIDGRLPGEKGYALR